MNGATTGRDGQRTIWLWAGGNGGDVGDNSNYDGYANSIYTIAIGAPSEEGTFNVTLGATNSLGTGNATLVITIGRESRHHP